MIFRIYPSKDTMVVDKEGLRPTSMSNLGASEILGLCRTLEDGTSNILIAFDTSSFPSPGSATASFHLVMKNARHGDTLPFAYHANVANVEQDWEEGRGHDYDYYTDYGVANWVSASLTEAWVSGGAWPSGTVPATFSFGTGYEDLDVEVTSLLPASYGFHVSIAETGSDLYIKKFHSRQTHFPSKRPYLEMRWDDSVTGSVSSSISDPTKKLVFSLYNLKQVYDAEETPTLRLVTRPYNWNPATVATASSDVSEAPLLDAYYRVVDDHSEEVLVPFGTGSGGSAPYTKMSYDSGGNYFTFPMRNVPEDTVCRFDFACQISGSWVFYRGHEFTFRVVR